MITETVRESCDRGAPVTGDFDGVTRAQALAALLAKAEAEETRPAVKLDLGRQLRRLVTMFGLAAAIVLAFAAAAAAQAGKMTSSRPPLSPAEAAAIMARVDSTANWTNRRVCTDCDGPRVASTGSRGPSSGPWDFPPETPRRRLDGTLLTDPPADAWYYPQVVVQPFVPFGFGSSCSPTAAPGGRK
jgi:hypothetical protein